MKGKELDVVIKLPKEILERFGHEYNEEDLVSDYVTEVILIALAKGIVLPEGHGDIVDIKTLIDMFWDGNSMEIANSDLSAIKPLIEADKKEPEEDKEEAKIMEVEIEIPEKVYERQAWLINKTEADKER